MRPFRQHWPSRSATRTCAAGYDHPTALGLIGDIDTLIAATALEYDLTLVTTDGDFTRVPGLKLLLLDCITLQPVVR
ncbi:MAG: type II toxin-antitoxin system VapC family toxin [Dehalococcoidia bacterium]